MRYTVLIDESGDQGLDNPEASEFMTMGAIAFASSEYDVLNRAREDILVKINEGRQAKRFDIHANKLSHMENVYVAREMSKLKFKAFAFVSKKSTLDRGYKKTMAENFEYANAPKPAFQYYNTCSRLLLEMVGGFFIQNNARPDSVKIVFEKGNQQLNSLQKLIRTSQANPKNDDVARLNGVSASNISLKTKTEEPMLQFADVITHGLYKVVSRDKFGLYEARYFEELLPKFARSSDGVIHKHGVNFMKYRQMGLDKMQRDLISRLEQDS